MKNKTCSTLTFILSVTAALLAVIDAFGASIWLTATSWLVVAAVLGIWAIYLDTCEIGKKEE